MRRNVMLLIAMALACRDSAGPASSPPPAIPLTTGAFVLERIDGNALPHSVEYTSSTCEVTAATLQLFSDTTFTWSNTCGATGGTGFARHPFVQVAQDSIVIPALGYRPTPPPHAVARRRGDTLTVFVGTWSKDYGAARTWVFRASP